MRNNMTQTDNTIENKSSRKLINDQRFTVSLIIIVIVDTCTWQLLGTKHCPKDVVYNCLILQQIYDMHSFTIFPVSWEN